MPRNRPPRNEIEAWLAGMILTDGHAFRDPRPGKTFRNLTLVQKEEARPVLERLGTVFNRPVWPARTNNAVTMTFLDLPYEWKTSVPVFQRYSDLERHYWRGAIDGDGCVTWEVHAPHRYKRIRFTYGTKEMFVGSAFAAYLDRLNVKYGDYPCYMGTKRRDMVIRADAENLARHLYTEADIFLPWKYERALEERY